MTHAFALVKWPKSPWPLSHPHPNVPSAFVALARRSILTYLLYSQHSQGNKQAEDEANKEAEAKMKEIKAAGQKGQDKVIKDLLKAVVDVKPVPPASA